MASCVVPAPPENKSECGVLTNANSSLPLCPPSLTLPTSLISVGLWGKKISNWLRFPYQEV